MGHLLRLGYARFAPCLPIAAFLIALSSGSAGCAKQSDGDLSDQTLVPEQSNSSSTDTYPSAGGNSGSDSSHTGGAPAGGSPGNGQTKGGSSSGGSTSSNANNPTSEKFSFFVTSQLGLATLSGSKDGFGGDLRYGQADGLGGADEICRQLAESSMPGNAKVWRAFLSATKGPTGTPVHAIDRIGEGPWYDRYGRVFALTKADLLNARPKGADTAIVNDFPNETGELNHSPGGVTIDNHNTLTGSSTSGTLDSEGLRATCQDWTSSASSGGKPRCGVTWPRDNITHWISTLNEGGCLPGATPGNGAQSGPQGTVGALGGYGAIYCFALTP